MYLLSLRLEARLELLLQKASLIVLFFAHIGIDLPRTVFSSACVAILFLAEVSSCGHLRSLDLEDFRFCDRLLIPSTSRKARP